MGEDHWRIIARGMTTVHYCEIKPGMSIGLSIGNTVRQVVTGFAAKTKYWESRCR